MSKTDLKRVSYPSDISIEHYNMISVALDVFRKKTKPRQYEAVIRGSQVFWDAVGYEYQQDCHTEFIEVQATINIQPDFESLSLTGSFSMSTLQL